MASVTRWCGLVLAWLVIGALVAAIAAAVVIPRVGGGTPYTVLTGSMSPDLPPGSLVVIRPVDAAELRPGMVITYQLESGESKVVTHRIVSTATTAAGERLFITQGDANRAADARPVHALQVRGVQWYSVPVLGRVGSILTAGQRQLAVRVISAGLGVYAAAMLISAWNGRRRQRSAAVGHDPLPRPGFEMSHG